MESLRRLLLAAEKEAITAKTVVETEKITSSSLHKEVSSCGKGRRVGVLVRSGASFLVVVGACGPLPITD